MIKVKGKAHLVREYLVHSYLYYECDVNLISDEEFNTICKELLENFDTIIHPHKYLINKDNLKANTALGVEYPQIVKDVSEKLFKNKTGKNTWKSR